MPEKKAENKSSYYPPVIFLIISSIFALPFLLKWNFIGPKDWELFTTMAAIPVKTILFYHQFPFWNPYIGGGNILFAHPEVAVFSPFFVIQLIFGAVGGLKLQILSAYFLGFWGSYLFSRKYGLSQTASYLVSFVYFGSSYFALHFSAGHIPFTHFCFLPWLLFFLLKSKENSKYMLTAALSIALIILGNGAAIPLLYTLFFSGVFVLLYSLEKKNVQYVKYYFFAVVVGILISSVKFIPMYFNLSQISWEGMPEDFTPIGLIPKIFFSFNQDLYLDPGSAARWDWHEYGAYISPIVVLLAVIGLIFRFRRCRLWLITAIFFLIFGLGDISGFSLWNLFSNLPGFASIRAPARAFQFVVLSVAVLSGFGLDFLILRFKNKIPKMKYLAQGLVGLVLLLNFLINLPSFRRIDYKLPADIIFNEDFKQEIGGMEKIYFQFQHNRGSLAAPWLSAYKESRGLVTSDNEVMMEYIPKGKITSLSRYYTPNRVEYEIIPSQAGTIVFSIGYDKGWNATDDRRLYEEYGLLATNFTANDRKLILTYRAPYFYTSLIISLLTIAGCLLVFFNKKLRF